MSDEQSFLTAIREHPLDDTVRGAYADWLDEQGGQNNGYRAEFIRAQLEAARGVDPKDLKIWHLLFYSASWFGDTCKALGLRWDSWGVMHDGTVHYEHKNSSNEFFVRRGFVDEIRVPLGWLLGYSCTRCQGTGEIAALSETPSICWVCQGTKKVGGCRDVLRFEPITLAILKDREPVIGSSIASWHLWTEGSSWVAPRADLPEELYERLKGGTENPWLSTVTYRTAELANKALSDAILQWAKS